MQTRYLNIKLIYGSYSYFAGDKRCPFDAASDTSGFLWTVIAASGTSSIGSYVGIIGINSRSKITDNIPPDSSKGVYNEK